MASAVSSFCGSRSAAFKAAAGLSRRQPVACGATAATMRKKDIHPEWYSEAKVFCNGVEVMTVGGTKQEYNVDVYSGNHPFYQV
jgi:large subunit ribosomal protein L31